MVGGEVEDYSVVITPAAECRITSYVHQLDSLLIFWEGFSLRDPYLAVNFIIALQGIFPSRN